RSSGGGPGDPRPAPETAGPEGPQPFPQRRDRCSAAGPCPPPTPAPPPGRPPAGRGSERGDPRDAGLPPGAHWAPAGPAPPGRPAPAHSSSSSSSRASQVASRSTGVSNSGFRSVNTRSCSASQAKETSSAPRRRSSSSTPRSVSYTAYSTGGNTVLTTACCSTSCRLAEPAAGEELAGRDTRVNGRSSCSEKTSATNGQGPMFAGSSCTHSTSPALGKPAS